MDVSKERSALKDFYILNLVLHTDGVGITSLRNVVELPDYMAPNHRCEKSRCNKFRCDAPSVGNVAHKLTEGTTKQAPAPVVWVGKAVLRLIVCVRRNMRSGDRNGPLQGRNTEQGCPPWHATAGSHFQTGHLTSPNS